MITVHVLTDGKKIRASRTILNMTRSTLADNCHISAALLQKIEGDDPSVKSDMTNVVLSYLEEQGFVFTDTSITLTNSSTPDKGTIMTETLSDDEIYKSLIQDKDFVERFGKWDSNTRENFFRVIRTLNKCGLDLWYVNMDGEIRAGSKSYEDQKGRPFAFMKLRNEGFTFDWHRKIAEYVPYIREFPVSFGHGTLVDDQFVLDLQNAVDNGAEIPPLMKSLAKGRLPSDYDK